MESEGLYDYCIYISFHHTCFITILCTVNRTQESKKPLSMSKVEYAEDNETKPVFGHNYKTTELMRSGKNLHV